MDELQFFEEAAAANGDRGLESQRAFPLPKWVDPVKIKAGQKFVRDHFFSVIFSHFISLIFLLCYSPVRKVLVKTQKSETSEKALKRYLSTLVHIKLWYEQDLLQREGEAAADVLRIREVHSRSARYIQKRCPIKSTNSEVGICANVDKPAYVISQLDMIVTQFGFMGFVALFPSKFGVFTNDPTGLEGFIHLWALIGHLLGIEDRFNLGLDINFPKSRAILEKILLPELKEGNEDSLQLCESLVTGMGNIVPFLSFNSILFFVKEMLPESSFTRECQHLSPNLSMYDFICFYLMTQCFTSWLQFTIVQQLLTALLRLAIMLGCAKFLETNNSAATSKVTDARRFSRSA